MENLLDAIQRERKNYGATMTNDECVSMCNIVAWKHRAMGWGLSGKKTGNRGKLSNGIDVAVDILHHKPSNTLVDVLVDAGGSSTPVWNILGIQENLTERPWVAPTYPESVGNDVAPTPVPVQPPASRESLQTAFAEIAELREQIRSNTEAITLLEQRLKFGVPVRIKTFFGYLTGMLGGE